MKGLLQISTRVTSLACMLAVMEFSEVYAERYSPNFNEKVETVFEAQPFLNLIDKQFTDLREGKIEEFYNNITSAKFRQSTSLEEFKQFVKQYAALSSYRSFQLRSFYFDDYMVSMQGWFISKNGDALTAELDFVWEEGKWKLFGLQLFKSDITPNRSFTTVTPS